MTFRNCVAVDLGASSGRVMLARYERECRSLTLREIHRLTMGCIVQNGYVTGMWIARKVPFALD